MIKKYIEKIVSEYLNDRGYPYTSDDFAKMNVQILDLKNRISNLEKPRTAAEVIAKHVRSHKKK